MKRMTHVLVAISAPDLDVRDESQMRDELVQAAKNVAAVYVGGELSRVLVDTYRIGPEMPPELR